MTSTSASLNEFRSALQRVLNSETFGHSNNFRRLLTYLGEKSLNEPAEELKEYTIGIEAFDKPYNYDPQQDPAVRVLASKLRHKLEEYYLREGAEDPVRIELPKGHYKLSFQFRPQTDPGFQVSFLDAQARKWRRISLVLAICTAAIILLTIYWRGSSAQHSYAAASTNQPWTPELELVWRPYLQSDRPVLISLGAPLFTKFSGGFFRNPKINEWELAEQSEQTHQIQQILQSRYAVPWHNFTGIGEATGAFLLSKLFHARKPDLLLKRSSVISWKDIQHNNVIFLGSPKFNRHLKDLLAQGDFLIEGGVIRNLRPRAGESNEYRDVWRTKRELLEDYALIHRLPGLHGNGEILVLASSSTEGTWAAVEHVTEAAHARELVSKLQLPSGKLPDSYQVVIKASFKEEAPVELSYVTHRALESSVASHRPLFNAPGSPVASTVK